MKKKLISTWLLGALVVTSTSVFVSCKDYDNDISDLRTQISEMQQANNDANAKVVAQIQEMVSSGRIISSVVSDANGNLIITLDNGKSFTITKGANGVDGQDGKDADVWTIGSDGYWYKNNVKTEYRAVGKDGTNGTNGTNGINGTNGTNGKDGKDGKDGTNGTNGKDGNDGNDGKDGADGKDGGFYRPNVNGTFDYVTYDANGAEVVTPTNITWQTPGTGLNSIVDSASGMMTITDTYINPETGKEETIVYNIPLSSMLRSLVFKPRFYYQGIEAFEVATFKYKELTLKKVNADGNYSTDKATEATSYFMMAPDMKAEYHLNPSNAKVDVAPEAWSIVAYNLETRATSSNNISSNFKVSEVEVANGIATVHSHYNGDVIKDIATDKKVTTLAVQYAQGDTVITSDYAALQTTQYKDLVLNNAWVLGSTTATPAAHKHLYTTASDAINNAAQIQVEYNNNDGIDLRNYVNTHRTFVKNDGTEDADKKWDDNAAKGTVENDGFKYSFELVGYYLGTNNTSQSAHAAINNDGYTLRPQSTSGGKQQPYGYSQSKEIIGRMPLVRVALTDTINNKVAAVGYIKVEIIDEGSTPGPIPSPSYMESFPTTTAEGNSIYPNNTYTLHCSDDSKTLKTLAWHEVEEKLMAKVNMDKATFEANYELDGSVDNADQFSHSVNNKGEDVWTLLTDKIGTVKRTTSDIAGSMTEVVQWTIMENQLYDIFVYKKKSAVETWVRYKRIGSGPVEYFYIQFIWTPAAINKTPKSAFGDGNKNPVAWYQKADVETNATAGHFDEIHGNVEVPGTNVKIDANSTITKTDAANDEFVFDIKSTLVGNKFSIDAISGYSGLGTPKVTARFIDGNGLYANAAGNKVYAESTMTNLVASIDPKTGVVRYEHGTKAEELLNAAGRDELTKNVRARVQVTAKACEGTGIVNSAKTEWNIADGINIPVDNSEFDVVFLRPINPKQASVSDFVDAETGGSLRNISLGFSDWRGTTVDSYLFSYYGISQMSIDFNNAWTDQTGSLKKLSSVNPNLKLSYVDINGTKHIANSNVTENIGYGNYGKILYENTGVTVGEFYIYIPYEISYDWGKFKSGTAQGDISKMIKCYVKKTM